MTREMVTVQPDDDTARAARLMLDNGLASLPVTNDGRLVGMISVTDILRAHTHTDEEIADALRERFFEYGESHPLGAVTVEDGVVTITDTENHLDRRRSPRRSPRPPRASWACGRSRPGERPRRAGNRVQSTTG